MKSSTFFSGRLIVFLLVLLFVATFTWLWWQDSISPADVSQKSTVEFTVLKNEGVRSIVSRLAKQNLIRSPTGFFILVKLLGVETQLQAGNYRLSQSMDAKTIALELTHGVYDRKLLIREGLRNEEIAQILDQELQIPPVEFEKFAKIGYMFPDTYFVSNEATAGAIAESFVQNFHKKVTPSMVEESKKTGLTFDEVIILASLVEREGRTEEDRPVIAGILMNRLRQDHPLQVDATLQYALGYQPNDKTWWKNMLSNDDKAIESPYNTYKFNGLPPTPISNPGLESILAVINAADTPYFFYLHDPEGSIHYAKNLDEHNANVRKYLQ
jgi:UPF0755 protein